MKDVTLNRQARQQLAAVVERCPAATPNRRRETIAPVLRQEIDGALAGLYDARVALSPLSETQGVVPGGALYRGIQVATLERLVRFFRPVWDAFDDVSWRGRLAAAQVVL